MKPKKTLLIDCDGVLYPISQLTTPEIVQAMNETTADYGIDKGAYERVSQRAKKTNARGIFNFIKLLSQEKQFDFTNFCQDMVEKIDYSRITRDDHLYQLLLKTAENYNPLILTNNCPEHVEKVLARRFGTTRAEFGIPCYDITAMEYDGRFYSKRMELGLKLFCDKIGIKPQNAVIIEDTPANIEVAKALGMDGVLINESRTLCSYLSSILPCRSPAKEAER